MNTLQQKWNVSYDIAAPISVIRIKMNGVTECIGKESKKLEQTIKAIKDTTGLDADIMLSSLKHILQ
jgi:hypothetical protein